VNEPQEARRPGLSEERREEEHRGMDWLLESVPDALLIVGAQGRIGRVNAQMAEMFGYRPEELVGLPIEALVPERFRATHRRHRRSYERNPRDRPLGTGLDIVGLRKDGTEFPIDVQLSHRRGPEGVVTIAAVRDMTARRQLEQERRQMEAQAERARHLESLVQLAGGVAHDFNNLLAVILTNASQASKEVTEASLIQPYLDEIEGAARNAADLTRQMLAYAGGGRLWIRPIRLSELISEIGESIAAAVGDRVEVRYRLAGSLPPIEADPDQLVALVGNLVRNAAEAIRPEAGEIEVETGVLSATRRFLGACQGAPDLREGTYVILRVRDSGVGMDAETRARVFEPFFTTKFVGRGMGMAAVLGIVRGHGGGIGIETGPGEGTAVTVLFPPVAARPAK
jgi:two-component system cell cycle sensor histidine kinase/response regulator CckA